MTRERSELDNLPWALSIYPLIAFSSGEDGVTAARALEATRLSDDSGSGLLQMLAAQARGIADLITNRWPQAASSLEHAIDLARRIRSGLFEEASTLSFLALARLGRETLEGPFVRQTRQFRSRAGPKAVVTGMPEPDRQSSRAIRKERRPIARDRPRRPHTSA